MVEEAGPRWTGRQVAAVWLFGVFTAIVGIALAIGLGWLDAEVVADGGQLSRTVGLAGTIQFGGMLLALWYLSATKGTGQFLEDFKLRFSRTDLVAVAWGLGLAFGLVAVLSLVLVVLDVELPTQEAVEAVEQSTEVWETVLLVFVILLLAPVVEEIVFRGMLHEVLRRRLPLRGTAWVGGSIFGLAHILDPAAAPLVPLLIVLGVVLAYVREKAGNLGKPILMHLGFNLLTVVTVLSASAIQVS